jgi:hypothetical protein
MVQIWAGNSYEGLTKQRSALSKHYSSSIWRKEFVRKFGIVLPYLTTDQL